jgi:hypothetical protein
VNGWLDVAAGVVLGLLINEGTEMSPWLAHKLVRQAAVIRQPDRIDDFVEARSATINDRPGKLFKLFTALGFLLAALAHRVAKPTPTGQPSPLRVMRVRVQAAGLASALNAATWCLISLATDASPFLPIVMGSGVFVVAVVMFTLPQLTWKDTLGCTVLFIALVSALWIGANPPALFIIVAMIAPVYGVAHAARALLCDRSLLSGIGSVVAVSAVITTVAMVRLGTASHSDVYPLLLFTFGMGMVAGLHVGLGLVVIEHANMDWDALMLAPRSDNLVPDDL